MLLRVGVLFVNHAEFVMGRLLQQTCSIHDSGKRRGSPTGAAHLTPALKVDCSTAVIGSYVGEPAFASNDALDDVLVARSGLIRTDAAATAASVVLLVGEIPVIIPVE